MNSLPGYDAWLTHDPNDRPYPKCVCGHDFEDHDDADVQMGDDTQVCWIADCDCKAYKEDYDEDR